MQIIFVGVRRVVGLRADERLPAGPRPGGLVVVTGVRLVRAAAAGDPAVSAAVAVGAVPDLSLSVSAYAPGRVCLAGESLDWMTGGPSVVAAVPVHTTVTVTPGDSFGPPVSRTALCSRHRTTERHRDHA